MDTINNKHMTIYATVFLVLILIILFKIGVTNESLKTLLVIGFCADIALLIPALIRWIKQGEISLFYNEDKDE